MCKKNRSDRLLLDKVRGRKLVKVGQTSDTSGGVRMMRGRDEVLWSVCVCARMYACVCVGSNQRHFINTLNSLTVHDVVL